MLITRVQCPKSLPALLWQWWEGVVACLHSDSTPFCSASYKSAFTSDLSTKSHYLICASHACEDASRQDKSAFQDRGQMSLHILVQGIDMFAQQRTSNSYFKIQIVHDLFVVSIFFFVLP